MPTSHRRPSRTEARRRARRLADSFTSQQIRILQAVVDHEGYAAAAIAMDLSESTVATTLKHMRSKAAVTATYQLTLIAAHRLTPPRRIIENNE